MSFNAIYCVEDFIYRIEHEGYTPSEEEIRYIGNLLGQPTKKLDVLTKRYRDVFSRYIEKKCHSYNGKDICIYTYSRRVPFKPIPVTMHATGTIIVFEEGKPIELAAFPLHKALSYAKSPGLDERSYANSIPKEVTVRIDGWQLTAYYNKLLNRWIFATRYVLHNMMFEAKRLVIEDFNNIVNPYVYVADKLAEEMGLYEKLKGFEGWTITFVLEGPEPAITKPPYPLGSDYKQYRLYLLMARDPKGRLYTWSESQKLLGIEIPQRIDVKPLKDLYRDIRRNLTVRSYIAYIETEDPINPVIAELESELYPDAAFARYLYDAKALAVITFEDADRELIEILDVEVRDRAEKIVKLLKEFIALLERIPLDRVEEISKSLAEYLKSWNIKVEEGEIIKTLKQMNIKRIAKKISALFFEGKSIRSDVDKEFSEFIDGIKSIVEEYRK